MTRRSVLLIGFLALLFPTANLQAADAAFTRTPDVIYGRKFGTALTMDVFTPKANANGAALIVAVSGGWHSDHRNIDSPFMVPYIEEAGKRGYTVFAVVHGSQPKFTIPEILRDMHRAVRYVRAHAKDYRIDPERIGITGGSAGGHLSLMQGTAGKDGDPKAKDPIDRVSDRPDFEIVSYGRLDMSVPLATGTLTCSPLISKITPVVGPLCAATVETTCATASSVFVPVISLKAVLRFTVTTEPWVVTERTDTSVGIAVPIVSFASAWSGPAKRAVSIDFSGAGIWTPRCRGTSPSVGPNRKIVTDTSDEARGCVVGVVGRLGLTSPRGTRLGEMALGCCWVGIPQPAANSATPTTANKPARRATTSTRNPRRARAA